MELSTSLKECVSELTNFLPANETCETITVERDTIKNCIATVESAISALTCEETSGK
jgi:hypothetical protein